MRILFDQGTPVPLRAALAGHQVETAYERGWSTLKNGELLKAAEAEGFEALITTDKNLRYQQKLPKRNLAILVLMTTDWRLMSRHTGLVVSAVAALRPGDYIELAFPPR